MKAFLSLITALLVSSGLCFFLSYLIVNQFDLNSNWYYGLFPVFFFILYIVEKTSRIVIESNIEKKQKLIAIEKSKYQEIEGLVCYKCRQKNNVNIMVNKENSFICENCGTRNKVLIGFKCASINEQAGTIDMDSAILRGEIDV